jgi:hypothetical protein
MNGKSEAKLRHYQHRPLLLKRQDQNPKPGAGFINILENSFEGIREVFH